MAAQKATAMKVIVPALAAIVSLAAITAQAQTMVEDTDGDGSYSFEELAAAYPDLTDELFDDIDKNDDDAVDEAELAEARENGLIAA